MFGKESSKSFDFALLKRRKEMKENPHLVANGRRRKGFYARRPMEGEGKGSFAWRPMEGKGKGFFSPLPTSPQAILLRPFLSELSFYFTMVLNHYLRISSLFLSLYIMIAHFDVTSPLSQP